MAEDHQFNTTAGSSANWWDSSSRNRFDQTVTGPSSSSSSSSGINNSTIVNLGSFGWETEMADVKNTRSNNNSMESAVFHDKIHDASSDHDHHHHQLQMMGLGLSSQPVEWNQSLLRGDKPDSSFRTILQENMNANMVSSSSSSSTSPASQILWRDSAVNNNRSFFVDQSQFSPHGGSSSDSTVTNFQNIDNNIYGAGNNSATMFQGFLGADQNSYSQYGGSAGSGGFVMNPSSDQLLGSPSSSSWPRPVPQFLRNSPPKPHSQMQFSNSGPFWNPAANVRPSFVPAMQTHMQTQPPNFDDKPKNLSMVKRSESDQPATKRVKNDAASSPSPAIKVRKEKMGDRIAALQQLVSPFGKTDAASVLSEAIEYIKFLHEQVTVLSTPYMKSGGASLQHQQSCDKSSKDQEGPRQDLRSRGLCLVPVSSTFPVTHETTVDFWTPTFGGTFR